MNNLSRQFDIKNKIKTIVEGLGTKLSSKIVFVGGSVVSFYSTKENIIDSRPTKDIDCVIQLTSRLSFNALEQELRKKGFENDLSQKAPVCRWIYENIIVDIMPDDPKILGFTNIWYKEGIETSVNYNVFDNLAIKIFSAPYFIASKIEAFKNRKIDDQNMSQDFEDIIYILSNRIEIIDEVSNSGDSVKQYLINEFKSLSKMPSINEKISYALPYKATLEEIQLIMKNISLIS